MGKRRKRASSRLCLFPLHNYCVGCVTLAQDAGSLCGDRKTAPRGPTRLVLLQLGPCRSHPPTSSVSPPGRVSDRRTPAARRGAESVLIPESVLSARRPVASCERSAQRAAPRSVTETWTGRRRVPSGRDGRKLSGPDGGSSGETRPGAPGPL